MGYDYVCKESGEHGWYQLLNWKIVHAENMLFAASIAVTTFFANVLLRFAEHLVPIVWASIYLGLFLIEYAYEHYVSNERDREHAEENELFHETLANSRENELN